MKRLLSETERLLLSRLLPRDESVKRLVEGEPPEALSAEERRRLCEELLDLSLREGFDSTWTPNRRGADLESLIDRLNPL